MPYVRKNARPWPRPRRSLQGFGDFNDESPCTSIPAGNAYRKPGNYCSTSDGGYTSFNADGSLVPTGVSSGNDASSIIGKIGGAILGALNQKPAMAPGVMMPASPGMSMTTKIALAGGALLVVALIARR